MNQKSSDYKYEVAISFAEEDRAIAQQIADELKRRRISHFYYPDHRAMLLGKDLLEVLLKIYGEQSMFVLMLISEHFANKKWADMERQISQMVSDKKDDIYILPVRLDNTKIDGLSSNVIYEWWNNNPVELVELIKRKIAIAKQDQLKKEDEQGPKESHIKIFEAKTQIINYNQSGDQVINIK